MLDFRLKAYKRWLESEEPFGQMSIILKLIIRRLPIIQP